EMEEAEQVPVEVTESDAQQDEVAEEAPEEMEEAEQVPVEVTESDAQQDEVTEKPPAEEPPAEEEGNTGKEGIDEEEEK
ncbi:MAG: hypothetical protein V3R44_03000, partial [bacterium]